MTCPTFEYRAPVTLDEALELLERYGEEARPLAGGHGLIPDLRRRVVVPRVLIDLRRIPGLSAIEPFPEGGFRIGALVTHADLVSSPLLTAGAPLLAEASAQVGDRQVRNFATLVGGLCQADPASDPPAALLALGAQVVVTGPRGERLVPVDSFLQGAGQLAIEPDELVIGVDVSGNWPGACSYLKWKGAASSHPLAGVAVQLTVSQGVVESAAVAVGAAAERPFRALAVERRLVGCLAADGPPQGCAAGAVEGQEVRDSWDSPADFRAHLVEVLVERALATAFRRTLS